MMMRRHGFEHSLDQRAGFKRFVPGNGNMMFAIQLSRKPHVGTVLTIKLITQDAQGFD